MLRSLQKFRVPSPLRPQTTIAIEKLKTAARDAQAIVNSIEMTLEYQKFTQVPPRNSLVGSFITSYDYGNSKNQNRLSVR